MNLLFVNVLFCLLFTLFIRMIIIFIPYRAAKTHVAMTYAGLIGFFVTIPLDFQTNHSMIVSNFLFFFIAIIGNIGCVAYRVNPLYPEKREKKPKSKK